MLSRTMMVLCFWLLLMTSASAQDTTYVYGGPGTLEGKFETAGGLPDRQGWIGVDLTLVTESHWQINTFNCANLDPGEPDNHAWWCGDVYTSCGAGDPAEGYGNNYIEYLDWYSTVPDPGNGVAVTVNAVLNYDNEPGFDFLYLKYESAVGMQIHATYNGKQDSVVVSVGFVLTPADYVGAGNDQVHLRWEFVSDNGYSDEDCEWPTAGAAQIDLIEVWFDQGGGPVQIGETETCEPGDPLQWEPAFRPGVGEFSQVWPLLDDLDPDHQNDTPQFAFIDDGVVVPGTGGTYCFTWCYGPDGWCVNGRGGLLGWGNNLHNEIWSPVIALTEMGDLDTRLSFETYRHNDAVVPPVVVDTWRVRSTADPTGTADWSSWRGEEGSHTSVPQYVKLDLLIEDRLEPGYRFVQIALGAHDLNVFWPWEQNPTPAPYFDNVMLYQVPNLGDMPSNGLTLLLGKPAPNPFNPSTTVSFTLPQAGPVELAVYDLRGRLVRVLLAEEKSAGSFTVAWRGRDEQGAAVAAGTYLFQLEAGGRKLVAKGSLLK